MFSNGLKSTTCANAIIQSVVPAMYNLIVMLDAPCLIRHARKREDWLIRCTLKRLGFYCYMYNCNGRANNKSL